MAETKHISSSRTVQGAVLALILGILPITGIDFDEGLVTELFNAALLIASSAYAIYGRYKAEGKISLK